MQPLSSTLRNQLERTVIAARDVAEEGAWAALQRLAVDKAQAPSHLSPAQREQRVKLRARGRQLGDVCRKNGEQDIYYLHSECAYEYWHQMLFARFLAENQLLMHPDGVSVSLEECEELAADEGTDGWTLAARYASRMLPQIFRPDDPLLAVTFAPEDKQALESLLADLPVDVFTADDSLGWVYQFWQTKRKKEVNDSGEKIGADELPAVTQLFTEDYMVKFLLHNTLGAWWAGKRLTANDAEDANDEEQLRQAVALRDVEWEYLRFVRGHDGKGGPWRPAAGTFDGWPKQAAELKIMDPCCGSGHFLVAAFHVMVRVRMEEEGLTAAEASDVVLRDNLHGLEIDQRCTQIAAFALAFAAWTLPDAGGYRELPELRIACTGIAPRATEEQWIKLAEESGIPMPLGGAEPIRNGLIDLHSLFSEAPTLGSLINPNELPGNLIAADYETIEPYVAAALAAEHTDQDTRERAVVAQGIVSAADLLAADYHLVTTNVPYLGRSKQDDVLGGHLGDHFKEGRADLATAFVLRCLQLCDSGGCIAAVTPQNWLFLTSYRHLRELLLKERTWNFVARLGENAFESSAAAGAFAAMLIMSAARSCVGASMASVDVSEVRQSADKGTLLKGHRTAQIAVVSQDTQLKTPDARITLGATSPQELLDTFAVASQGIPTSDSPLFVRVFWELDVLTSDWEFHQGSVVAHSHYGGRESMILFENGCGRLRKMSAEQARDRRRDFQGANAWGKSGVCVRLMRTLPCTLYTGEKFDNNVSAIVPTDQTLVPALWAYCTSSEFAREVRALDQKLNVTNATLAKVPFDIARWRKAATEKYPDGLPEPDSDDPTQWLFHGWPEESTAQLQVGVARLLGYRWPAEVDQNMRLSKRARALAKRCDELIHFADADGIACIPAVAGERTAADRLQSLLSTCGVPPSASLDDWLRDKFFEEHCQLFHQRPFVWHIWDGRRKDGFHALVNYHKLDRKLLEKLIYSHLGDWIARQKAAESRGEGGAEARRLAAEDLQDRLKLIVAGEPPCDIFARWKPLEEQPIGWDPDLNDGVRVNIRPFVNAGVLRKNPKIKWKKDRGKEPERPKEQYPWFWSWDEETDDFTGGTEFDGNRWNDCHYSTTVKQQARDAANGGSK